MRYIILCYCFFLASICTAQQGDFPTDTLYNRQLELLEIDRLRGNTYRFNAVINTDSLFLILPVQLPRGYFEAYYNQDTNHLALTLYNYPRTRYAQQYYEEGGMKSDTEYDRQGRPHGVHVLYLRNGEEHWHAEYVHGRLMNRYTLKSVAKKIRTQNAIQSGKAWGKYRFDPTPSRARSDEIELLSDTTFIYRTALDKKGKKSEARGIWHLEGSFLYFTLTSNTLVWRKPTRKMILIGTPKFRQLELLEVQNWGLDWYHSEYKKQ